MGIGVDMVKEQLKTIEEIRLGDIHLVSSKYCVAQLCSIVESLLKNKDIKDYLEKLKEQKASGGLYFG